MNLEEFAKKILKTFLSMIKFNKFLFDRFKKKSHSL